MAIKRSEIRVELSAPSQKQPAHSVRWAAPVLADAGAKRVVDFGCGLLRNLKVLRSTFDRITLVETERRCEQLRSQNDFAGRIRLLSTKEFEAERTRYDAAFLISVLHIVPDPKERRDIVRNLISKLRPNGFLVVDVPQSETYYNRRKDKLPIYKDGYLMKRGSCYTFYKSFLSEELDTIFNATQTLRLYQTTYISKHLIRIWQKTSNSE